MTVICALSKLLLTLYDHISHYTHYFPKSKQRFGSVIIKTQSSLQKSAPLAGAAAVHHPSSSSTSPVHEKVQGMQARRHRWPRRISANQSAWLDESVRPKLQQYGPSWRIVCLSIRDLQFQHREVSKKNCLNNVNNQVMPTLPSDETALDTLLEAQVDM